MSAIARPAAEQAAATSTRTYSKRRKPFRPSGWTIVGWVFLLFLLIFTVVPMAWMLSTSLKTEFASIQQPPDWIPDNITFEEYTTLLNPNNQLGSEFLRYLRNSIFVSTMTTIIGLVVAVPAAYAFSRFSFPGKEALFFSVLVRNMFPVVVFLIPLFILMRNLRLDRQSMVADPDLPHVWVCRSRSGCMKGFFDNIPPELERAARIDGATRFQAFRLIVMPLSSPGIIATAIYAFIQGWNEYVYAAHVPEQ